MLHSAGGNTHSVRSGTTLTSSYLLYQALTAGQRLCAAFGWRQHTLSEIRDNSDKFIFIIPGTDSRRQHTLTEIRDNSYKFIFIIPGIDSRRQHTLSEIRDNSDKFIFIIPGVESRTATLC